MSIFDFTVKDAKGNDVNLKDYAGKVILVINSATGCGFTPQYEELQKLYTDYEDKGFVILDFPCNQFANQAPGTNDEIVTFCSTRFGITFPIFSKIDVNGENESPVFTYLKSQKGFEGFGKGHPLIKIISGIVSKMDPDYKNNSSIKWNFTKFLIDRDGNVVERYEPTEDIKKIEEKVKELL